VEKNDARRQCQEAEQEEEMDEVDVVRVENEEKEMKVGKKNQRTMQVLTTVIFEEEGEETESRKFGTEKQAGIEEMAITRGTRNDTTRKGNRFCV
jgi:hypothetical protein